MVAGGTTGWVGGGGEVHAVSGGRNNTQACMTQPAHHTHVPPMKSLFEMCRRLPRAAAMVKGWAVEEAEERPTATAPRVDGVAAPAVVRVARKSLPAPAPLRQPASIIVLVLRVLWGWRGDAWVAAWGSILGSVGPVSFLFLVPRLGHFPTSPVLLVTRCTSRAFLPLGMRLLIPVFPRTRTGRPASKGEPLPAAALQTEDKEHVSPPPPRTRARI